MILLGQIFRAVALNLTFTLLTLVPAVSYVIVRIKTAENAEKGGRVVSRGTVRPRRPRGGRVRSSRPTRSRVTRSVAQKGSTPYWEKRGWRRSNGAIVGHFNTNHGRFRGRIEDYYTNDPQLYIYDPPPELSSHPHWHCFIPKEGDKFYVHFANKGPLDLASAIEKVEEAIDDSF